MCTSTCPLSSGKVNEVNVYYPVKVRVEAALQKYFPKLSGFCPGQLEALLALLHGRDVFVRMATGSGKSLCTFLACLALAESAIGVVISPLNALKEQQVWQVIQLVL